MIQEEARVLIRTEGLGKQCKLGDLTVSAIKDLDIRISQCEFVIIQGISGIQKNSFFNLLGCLERPDAGKYYYDYEDIALAEDKLVEDIRRSRIGYLFRDFRLIERLTAYQNISVPTYGLNITAGEKADRINAAIRKIGIEKITHERASGLPNFEKQLVGLARAIVNNPIMLMADEPSANLGTDESCSLMGHLKRLNEEGITILLFTSDNSVRLPDNYRVLTFEDGKLSSDREENRLVLSNGGSI